MQPIYECLSNIYQFFWKNNTRIVYLNLVLENDAFPLSSNGRMLIDKAAVSCFNALSQHFRGGSEA
jgi:hypothetical protein